VTLVRLGALALPLAVVMGLFAGIGALVWGQAVPWHFLARALAVCGALLGPTSASASPPRS
jgi:hypothetical protein